LPSTATWPRLSDTAALEDTDVQGGEDALEGVVRGDAAGQGQKTFEPTLALLGKQGDVGPVVAVGNHAADSQDDEVDESMRGASNDAGIFERAEVLANRAEPWGGSHAILRERDAKSGES
jgi:hypothetical protein